MKPSTNGNGYAAHSPERNGHEERHEWQFRDQHIPSKICYLVQKEKRFSGKDMLLCFVIDSLVKPLQGCWASDKYLSRAVGLHPINVNKRLRWLKNKGIIIIIKTGGRRFIETAWSRTPNEIKSFTGVYGETLREAWGSTLSLCTKPMSYKDYLKTDHWKAFRKKAIRRAGYKCQLCNKTGKLHTHHRTYERIGCELLDDVTILCVRCHEKYHDVLPVESGEDR